MLKINNNNLLFSFFFFFFFISLLGLTTAGQESIQFLNLHHKISPSSVSSDFPVAVFVSGSQLPQISRSVLMAETWLRSSVLPHFPSTNITTIVVGNVSSSLNQDARKLDLLLLSLKNLFHSLKRWGLENQIKVSTLVSNDCNGDGVEGVVEFIKSTNSTLTLKLPENVISEDETEKFVSTQMNKFGPLNIEKVNLITGDSNRRNPITRKLFSFMEFDEYESEAPLPSDLASPASPPESQIASPPEWEFAGSPFVVPASAPVGFGLPPCEPASAPFPQTGGVQKQWCVAKPSVPAEILQAAMDYACGDGGGDCREIAAEGRCFHPDSLVAHASYAFNSYWQKNKRSGGTCSFGGTAMVITTDPSFHNCRFVLS